VSEPIRPATRDGKSDHPLRDAGTQLLSRFNAAARIGRSYDADNQVFLNQLKLLLDTFTPVLEEHGEAVLVAIEDDLFLNGVRLPVRPNTIRFHNSTIAEFERRKISGFRAVKGLELRELNVFIRLFLQPEVYLGAELLTACLAQGTDHLVPVIHASTEEPDPAGEKWAEWEGEASNEEEPDSATSWATPGAESGGYPTGYGQSSSTASNTGSGPGGGSGNAPRGAVRKKFSAALSGARSLLTTTSLQGGMELRHAKRVVQPLVDGAFASEPVVLGLTNLHHRDEYTYAHAVNVCLVAVSMGHHLQLDRKALADLGVASLLHDVGKDAVSDEIKNPLEEFTTAEREAAQRHPLEGARIIAGSTTLNPTTVRCMRAALEHHITADGAGYPQLGEWKPSVLSRIISLADCYVSLQAHRSERGAGVTPYQALGMVLGPLKKRFTPGLLWALIQSVGFYPPGQMVELDDGSIAIVLAPNSADLARPNLKLLVEPNGRRPAEGATILLTPLPPEREIRRALRAEEYPNLEDVPAS
jgi:HD-GYP domain-containing protein (c-di-GMP phosphodiesterase class II)